MSALALLLAFFFGGQPATLEQPRVSRTALAAVEKTFDQRLEKASITDPFDLLGTTRGVYLEGYGAVFSAELNLIVSPNLSPFHQRFTKQEIARIHDRKLQRLPLLKQNMREMLIASAATLENLPPSEQVVLAISLFHYSWEDTAGIPGQIVMQAQRQQLLSSATRESAIRTQEF
jgi:hypothetical protein